MNAPVDGFSAFSEPAQLWPPIVVLSPPTYSLVPSNAADADVTGSEFGLPPPTAMRVVQTGPDAERVPLERVVDAVLVDRADEPSRLAADDTGEQRRRRPEVAVVCLLRGRHRPRAHEAQVGRVHLDDGRGERFGAGAGARLPVVK